MPSERTLPKAQPCVPEEDISSLLDDFAAILRSGQLTRGEYLDRFECEFAAAIGTKHAVGLSSGTAPLEIALRHWNVEDGEVIVPTNTFIASANAAILAGGKPVLADISPTTLSSTLREIRERVTARTRAVVAVHIAGLIDPEIDDLATFCRERDLFLLEDAAHAHGASLGGRKAGSLGDAAGFSFFPTKVITSGEGGIITTDDDQLAAFARSFRCHGLADQGRDLIRLGSNYRLPELSAALGLSQLQHLDEFVRERSRLAALYADHLRSLPGIQLFLPTAGQVHPYYKFPILIPKGYDRRQVTAQLRESGIPIGSVYWPPIHLEPFYREHFGYREGDFPVAEKLLQRTITLPLFVGLSDGDVEHVCHSLREIL
jgi:perosamine synthetase